MKIRTDFVTNSSSSSFVTYTLKDSDFCRFVYEKIQEYGLEYPDEGYTYSPISRWRGDGCYVHYFTENSFSVDISCSWSFCDRYAPESFVPEFKGFESDICSIADFIKNEDAKEELRKIISEELHTENNNTVKAFSDLLCSDDDEDDAVESVRDEMMYYLESWQAGRVLLDNENIHLCEKLYNLLKNAECDGMHIRKDDEKIKITFDAENTTESDLLVIFPNRLFAFVFDGYSEEEHKKDIETALKCFIDEISAIPTFEDIYMELVEIGENEKLQELFDKDLAEGKVECDVYMGRTD